MELENLSTNQIERYCKEGLDQLRNKDIHVYYTCMFLYLTGARYNEVENKQVTIDERAKEIVIKSSKGGNWRVLSVANDDWQAVLDWRNMGLLDNPIPARTLLRRVHEMSHLGWFQTKAERVPMYVFRYLYMKKLWLTNPTLAYCQPRSGEKDSKNFFWYVNGKINFSDKFLAR